MKLPASSSNDDAIVCELVSIPAALLKGIAESLHLCLELLQEACKRIELTDFAAKIVLLQGIGDVVKEEFAAITQVAGVGVVLITQSPPLKPVLPLKGVPHALQQRRLRFWAVLAEGKV